MFVAQPPEDGKPYFAVGYAVPKRFQKQGRAKDILVAAILICECIAFVDKGDVCVGTQFQSQSQRIIRQGRTLACPLCCLPDLPCRSGQSAGRHPGKTSEMSTVYTDINEESSK